MSARSASPATSDAAIWHRIECGGYAADLPLWRELAALAGGPVLELGCGTGRVALHLARAGHRVVAVDHDEDLVAALRARLDGVEEAALVALQADITALTLDRSFALVIAPMQVIQLLDGPDGRREALRRARAHLMPGGRIAIALVEGVPAAARAPAAGAVDMLPDVLEDRGWIYSSLPLGVERDGDRLLVRRLRQRVSPAGEMRESTSIDRLAVLDAARLEAEGAACGLRALARFEVAATEAHIGSQVLLLEVAA